MNIEDHRRDISRWTLLQLERSYCSHSKPLTWNKIEALADSLWGRSAVPFSTKWQLDKKDANGKPEHVPAIAKILFHQSRTPLYHEVLGNFLVCSPESESQLEIFDTVIMIYFFQAGQLINYGIQYEAKPTASALHDLKPWWIILEDVTSRAGGKRMFLADILNALWLQRGMTWKHSERLISRAKDLTKKKMEEYVTHKGILHQDAQDSNVVFELSLNHSSEDDLNPSDLNDATCGLQSAELIDWAEWTDKKVGKHTHPGADEQGALIIIYLGLEY